MSVEATERLQEEVRGLLFRHQSEYHITYAEAIGVLMLSVHELGIGSIAVQRALDEELEEDEDNDRE